MRECTASSYIVISGFVQVTEKKHFSQFLSMSFDKCSLVSGYSFAVTLRLPMPRNIRIRTELLVLLIQSHHAAG